MKSFQLLSLATLLVSIGFCVAQQSKFWMTFDFVRWWSTDFLFLNITHNSPISMWATCCPRKETQQSSDSHSRVWSRWNLQVDSVSSPFSWRKKILSMLGSWRIHHHFTITEDQSLWVSPKEVWKHEPKWSTGSWSIHPPMCWRWYIPRETMSWLYRTLLVCRSYHRNTKINFNCPRNRFYRP